MFKTRLLSGILLVIIALATIISGDYVLFFTLLAVSLIGMRELYRAMKVQDEKINLLAAAGYLGAVLYYLAVLLDFERYGVLAIIFGLVLLMFVYVFTYPTYEAGQVMPALFGIVYVAVMLSFIYLTRELPGGKFHVWLIFLCSWGCDTCAYCVGMLIGKHKWHLSSALRNLWRSCGWCGRSCTSWCDLCSSHSGTDAGICCDLCNRSVDFHGRRSGCICDQEKSGD